MKGRKPYQEGTPCSHCPLGYSCENSLCGEWQARAEMGWGVSPPSTPGLGDLASQDSRLEKQERGLRDVMAETLCDFLPSLNSRLGCDRFHL